VLSRRWHSSVAAALRSHCRKQLPARFPPAAAGLCCGPRHRALETAQLSRTTTVPVATAPPRACFTASFRRVSASSARSTKDFSLLSASLACCSREICGGGVGWGVEKSACVVMGY
jgi:hypothetical protein